MDPHDIYLRTFVKHDGEIYGVWDDFPHRSQLLRLLLPLNWADSKLPKTMSLSCYEHCHRKKKAAAHMVAAAFHEKAS